MHVPNISKEYVQSFCRRVVPGGKPIYVPVQPLPNKPVNECFAIIPEHVSRYGGEQRVGWAIWEPWRKVLIEAEFHAIWKSPQREMIDLTPKEVSIQQILFIHDPRREYEGLAVNNIRHPLVRDSRVRRLCELYELRFAELNKGDLAYQYGRIALSGEAADRMRKIQDEMEQLTRDLMRVYPKR